MSDERPGEPAAREHPPREPADDLEPLRVDVHQRELVDVEPPRREPDTSSGV